MKQIPITPEITAKIHAVVGPDVDTASLAVFESIAANTLPLNKRGTIFNGGRISALTLRQMADYITTNGVPLIQDHRLGEGAPVGKLFDASVIVNTDGPTLTAELRTLFYLDATEGVLTAKINAGVMDEVSPGFLASQLLCSECGWDYLDTAAGATWENVYNCTCGNGHEIGVDGVHVNLVGLNQFYETSLVTRGAGSKPKIVGKSAAKVPSASSMRLAASGFELDELVLHATLGEHTVDMKDLIAQLSDTKAETALAKAELTAEKAKTVAAEAALAAAQTEIDALKAKLADAATAADATAAAELTEARAALTAQFTALTAATGETGVEAPTTVADLKAGIDARTAKLTALIPVDGVSKPAADNKPQVDRDFSGFKTAR